MQKFIYCYAHNRLLIFKRSFVIPVRNAIMRYKKNTKVPSDWKKGELKGEIAAQRRENPFWTSLFKNRRRNYFSRRYCRGFFIVPRI